MSKGLEIIEFLKNNGWLLSWIAIPGVVIVLLLRDYIAERKAHKVYVNTKDLYNGYYYLVLTLDPNPINDKGEYRWYRMNNMKGCFLSFNKEPEAIATAIGDTGLHNYVAPNMDIATQGESLYSMWFISSPDTLLMWFVERLGEENIFHTANGEMLRTIKDIKRLWDEAQIKSDVNIRKEGFDMTQFKLLEVHLSTQQKAGLVPTNNTEEKQTRKPVLSIHEQAPIQSALVTGHRVFIENQEGCNKAINCRAYLSLNIQKEDVVLSLNDFRSAVESRISKQGNAYTPSELDKWVLNLFSGNVGIHVIGHTFAEIQNSQIYWAEIENPPSIDIGGGEEKGLEVCRVIGFMHHSFICLFICIPTHTKWNDNILAVLKGEHREYQGELIIKADNTNTIKRQFTIAPNDKGNVIQIIWS